MFNRFSEVAFPGRRCEHIAMADLFVGLAYVFVVSALLLLGGTFFAKRAPHWLSNVVMIFLVAALAWFLWSDPDRLWLAAPLPVSSLIVVGNITLPVVALLCGIAFARMPGHAVRRSVLLAPLLGLAAFNLVRPILGNPPALGDRWKGDICRQTSGNSCGPAAAATLLRAFGIDATEGEMARLCLTRPGGTPMAGVYRGLVIKTAGQPYRPQPFYCNLDTLLKTQGGPVLLTVGLQMGANVDPRFQERWGWAPGVRHTIVLFRLLANDRVEVGDPDAGREIWTIESLKVLWRGSGIRLVSRP
jgi:hypothetical protein